MGQWRRRHAQQNSAGSMSDPTPPDACCSRTSSLLWSSEKPRWSKAVCMYEYSTHTVPYEQVWRCARGRGPLLKRSMGRYDIRYPSNPPAPLAVFPGGKPEPTLDGGVCACSQICRIAYRFIQRTCIDCACVSAWVGGRAGGCKRARIKYCLSTLPRRVDRRR